jgi:hypothetical protein
VREALHLVAAQTDLLEQLGDPAFDLVCAEAFEIAQRLGDDLLGAQARIERRSTRSPLR